MGEIYAEVISLRRRLNELETKIVEIPEDVTCRVLGSFEKGSYSVDVLMCFSSKPFYIVMEVCDVDEGVCTKRVYMGKKIEEPQEELPLLVEVEGKTAELSKEEIEKLKEKLAMLGY